MMNENNSLHIVVVREDHLGDLVLTTPLFRALSLGGHQVTVVARRSYLPILQGNPHIKQIVALEDLAPDFPKSILALGRGIRRLRPDLVMIPHAKPISLPLGIRIGFLGRIIAMWGGVTSRLLLCRSLRSGLPNHRRHYSEIMLDLARAIEVKAQGLTPEIFLATEEQQAGKEELRRRFGLRKVVVIHPGCAGNTCNLPISVYADLIALVLDATNVGIILSGVSLERKKFHSQLCRFDDHPRVWNSMGEVSLRQYCGIIAASNLLLAPSTGPLHIASALGIETISPFCRKAVLCSNIWGNLGSKNIVLEPPASICERRGTGDHCDFKKSIGSSQLLEAIRRFIEG